MKSFVSLVLMLISSLSIAAPFVQSDPTTDARVDTCTAYMDAVPGVTVPVVLATLPLVGKACKFDIASVTVGAHSITMTFRNSLDTTVWGESAKSLPLAFTRPAVLPVPSGLLLVP
jgi:hypothetical protein